MATLQELIAKRKAELGLSYRQLGRRAKLAGAATEPNFHHLASGPLQEFPKVRTIDSIAAALGVSPEEVADAALESLGLRSTRIDVPSLVHLHAVPTGEKWIAISTGNMSPDEIAETENAAAKMVTDVVKRRRSSRLADSDSDSTTDPPTE